MLKPVLCWGSTVSDLIDEDTFLLVQADPDDNILEYAEQNTQQCKLLGKPMLS